MRSNLANGYNFRYFAFRGEKNRLFTGLCPQQSNQLFVAMPGDENAAITIFVVVWILW